MQQQCLYDLIMWGIIFSHRVNPNPLGCVQNRIQIGGFWTVRVNLKLALQFHALPIKTILSL